MLNKLQKFFPGMLILLSLFFLVPKQVVAGTAQGCICTVDGSSSCLPKEVCAYGGTCGATCTYQTKDSPSGSSGGSASTKSSSACPGYLGCSGIAKYIPDCTTIKGTQCSDVSVFLITAVGIGQYVFGIIGVLALVMFVYGGIVWITASGNPEKVKQGMGIFMSAVIGLVIVFSAYMLVKYFGSTILNIGSDYQLK